MVQTTIDILKWPRRRLLRLLGPSHIVKRALTYREDGLFTTHDCSFIEDERFRRAYQAGFATDSSKSAHIRWRVHVILTAAAHALHLPGDFVECGTNRGFLARAICEYLDFAKLQRRFWLLDTFSGIPAQYETHLSPDYYKECYADVCETFRQFPNVRLIRGEIPSTLGQVKTDQVAFLSIDLNAAVPERASIEYFWPRLVPGGIVIYDDYGWTMHHAQKLTADQFAKSHGVEIFNLPTAQGMLIKP